jgi:hypothetical protein
MKGQVKGEANTSGNIVKGDVLDDLGLARSEALALKVKATLLGAILLRATGAETRRIYSLATNSLGYLPDWEARSLQVSFRRAISCATLLRWDPMHAKFLYPNRFQGLVLDGGML